MAEGFLQEYRPMRTDEGGQDRENHPSLSSWKVKAEPSYRFGFSGTWEEGTVEAGMVIGRYQKGVIMHEDQQERARYTVPVTYNFRVEEDCGVTEV